MIALEDPALVTFGSSPGSVNDGRWSHDPTLGVAGYKLLDLGRPVAGIGLTATFPARRSGAVALVIPDQDWSQAGNDWSAGVHFVASRTRWHLAHYGQRQARPTYARGVFLPLLAVGQGHTFRLDVEGGRVRLHLPSGRVRTAEHSLITPGRYAVFELFTGPDRESASISSVVASSD